MIKLLITILRKKKVQAQRQARFQQYLKLREEI